MKDQNGRVVVVTGGGSGMGRAIARRFAHNGDTVYVLGRTAKKLQETAEGFSNIACSVTDVTDMSAVEKVRDEIAKEHGRVDVLVNNAGGSRSMGPEVTAEKAAEVWNEVLTTNLSSVFYVTFAFDKLLTRPGGRIITISSVAALAGSSSPAVGGQVYAASKAGIHGLSRTLMKAYAPQGITVNCIAPGVIDDTGFFGGDGVPEDRKKGYLDAIPVGRLGEPEEIAAAAFYLASGDAGFITGEILNINGGAQFGR